MVISILNPSLYYKPCNGRVAWYTRVCMRVKLMSTKFCAGNTFWDHRPGPVSKNAT